MQMARPSKANQLAAIQARREVLQAKLVALDERAKAAELAARDAGRPTLLAALGRVKSATICKPTAPLLTSPGQPSRPDAGALP
ncbi:MULTISPECIES: hypothetical protein [Sphingomonas]|uniref:Uncharacterized protein n=1 Tax=Sphingomonas kyungheensis TaxID=1069987 RepID=A0ABU8H718_9SPHN|nr:hypothetical protein [Sphingomonas sp. CV7422]